MGLAGLLRTAKDVLPRVRRAGAGAVDDPAVGLQRDLVRLIGNVAHGNAEVQAVVRTAIVTCACVVGDSRSDSPRLSAPLAVFREHTPSTHHHRGAIL